MIQIDKALLDDLFAKAKESDRKRMNYDLRTSSNDGSQRMLNALLPGSIVPIHRHPKSFRVYSDKNERNRPNKENQSKLANAIRAELDGPQEQE